MTLSQLWFDPTEFMVDGIWRVADETLAVENPSNGQKICEISMCSARDVDDAVAAAQSARSGPWGTSTAAERGRLLSAMGKLVETRIEELAIIEAHDVGKPLSQARADARALARYLEYYGGAADKIMGETIPYLDGYTVYTLREPHGVTGHIVPWNYPMQIIGRSVTAALAMGNTCVLKPAEEACLTALAYARIAQDAGLPAGVLNVVPGKGEIAGAALSAHKGVQHLSFTGSVSVGRKIQRAAADNIVPVTLELGGKSPQLVFADADLDTALPFLVGPGIQNAGQTCSAASRILVERSILDKVLDAMRARYQGLHVGDAMDDLDVGPLISSRQHEIVSDFLDQPSGAQVIAQAELKNGLPEGGYYFPPTLFLVNDFRSRLAQEEIFGPVQVVIPFDGEDEAVEIANGTNFGLVASVWTKDGARQMRLAKKLDVGQVFINNYGAGGGVELPFGGVGHSGHGREKGFEALYSFSRTKTVAAKHG